MLKTITLVSYLLPLYILCNLKKMKNMLIVLATWLFCNIAIGSCLNAAINYPSVKFTTHDASTGSYQSFLSTLRSALDSGSDSHGIPLLRKKSEITSKNEYLQVDLINYDTQLNITLAITVVNVYVIGFKSGGKSFFLSDAPSNAINLLFGGTSKTTLKLDTNYQSLGDRSRVGLGIGPLKKAINALNNFNGAVSDSLKESLLVVIQMVAEAARFKYIEKQIDNYLLGEYKPKSDTLSLENSWDALSTQIQESSTAGKFKTPVTLQYANSTRYNVTTVEQVKPDISILLCKGSGRTVGQERFGEIFVEKVVENWLPML
ncbi:ribosome-inactivating protein cucurmosin-like [Euphorbia lathyris]|uniref:ribosome-inactivating protein cucurmosin-like n=1 Tax=Euphorbia lathyris TaxID=212925 RepID=UPI003313AE67